MLDKYTDCHPERSAAKSKDLRLLFGPGFPSPAPKAWETTIPKLTQTSSRKLGANSPLLHPHSPPLIQEP